MHLLVKWSPVRLAGTLVRHRLVAETAGSVWWGCETEDPTRRPAPERIDQLNAQLRESLATHAFLFRLGSSPVEAEVWKAALHSVTTNESETDPDRRPREFVGSQCFVYLELGEFEPVEPGWIVDHLELYDQPGHSLDAGALGNQTSPLYVTLR